jgi:LysR family transcriptional activator of nhaA
MKDRVRIECCEDAPHRLIAALAAHTLDLVISDSPAPPGLVEASRADALEFARSDASSRAYSHLLGECGVSLFGAARMAKELRIGFPKSLDGAPFLLPMPNTALRRELDAWLVARGVVPKVVGEFQDAALLSEFADAGVGLFAAPDAIAPRKGELKGIRRVGPLKPLRSRYYAITVERRILHPAVAQIAGAAREKIFAPPPR